MQIIGRLTRDAEVNTLPNDKQVVNFSVAVNDSYSNKQGEKVKLTEYFNCAYWLSPKVAQVLTKGTVVELTGRVSARAWVASDGSPRASLNFHTSKITLHGGGNKNQPLADATENSSPAVTSKGRKKGNAAQSDDLPF